MGSQDPPRIGGKNNGVLKKIDAPPKSEIGLTE